MGRHEYWYAHMRRQVFLRLCLIGPQSFCTLWCSFKYVSGRIFLLLSETLLIICCKQIFAVMIKNHKTKVNPKIFTELGLNLIFWILEVYISHEHNLPWKVGETCILIRLKGKFKTWMDNLKSYKNCLFPILDRIKFIPVAIFSIREQVSKNLHIKCWKLERTLLQ